jgi:hypothetical protein
MNRTRKRVSYLDEIATRNHTKWPTCDTLPPLNFSGPLVLNGYRTAVIRRAIFCSASNTANAKK